jgi:hypothetical protein
LEAEVAVHATLKAQLDDSTENVSLLQAQLARQVGSSEWRAAP